MHQKSELFTLASAALASGRNAPDPLRRQAWTDETCRVPASRKEARDHWNPLLGPATGSVRQLAVCCPGQTEPVPKEGGLSRVCALLGARLRTTFDKPRIAWNDKAVATDLVVAVRRQRLRRLGQHDVDLCAANPVVRHAEAVARNLIPVQP